MNELRLTHKRPIAAMDNTRIDGHSFLCGNGIDEYDIRIEWIDVEDTKYTPHKEMVLKEAFIRIRLKVA